MKDEWKLPKKSLLSIGITVAIVLLVILFFSGRNTSQPAPESTPLPIPEEAPELALGWARFADPQGRFTIDIPELAETLTQKGDMAAVGYLPTCNPETGIVCAYLPKTTFPRTNFDGAGVSVNILENARTSASCLATRPGEHQTESNESRMIGGIPFLAFPASDAAMSHQSAGTNYRTFYSNTCYELTARINTTTFEVYEEGSVERFTDESRTTVERILDKILGSFRFS